MTSEAMRVSTQLPVASATRAAAALIGRGSSREDVAVQGIEGAATLLLDGHFRKRRRRTQHLAEARTSRTFLLLLLRHLTDLFLHHLGVLVAGLQLIRDLRRD